MTYIKKKQKSRTLITSALLCIISLQQSSYLRQIPQYFYFYAFSNAKVRQSW